MSDTPNDGKAVRGGPLLRTYVGLICRLLAKYSGVLPFFAAEYPTVVAALQALTAACVATGFDKPDEKTGIIS